LVISQASAGLRARVGPFKRFEIWYWRFSGNEFYQSQGESSIDRLFN
jgi:hypothetical protein